MVKLNQQKRSKRGICRNNRINYVDGQNPPSELKKLLDIFEAKNADGVVGYRQDRQDSKMKTVPSKIANFLFRLLTSSSIKDLGCSLKILKKNI